VCLVDDVDLVTPERGRQPDLLAEVADLVDAIVEVSTLLMAFGGRRVNAPI